MMAFMTNFFRFFVNLFWTIPWTWKISGPQKPTGTQKNGIDALATNENFEKIRNIIRELILKEIGILLIQPAVKKVDQYQPRQLQVFITKERIEGTTKFQTIGDPYFVSKMFERYWFIIVDPIYEEIFGCPQPERKSHDTFTFSIFFKVN